MSRPVHGIRAAAVPIAVQRAADPTPHLAGCTGPTGYRLARVHPHPDALAPHPPEVTTSEQPAPLLSTPGPITPAGGG